MNNRYLRTGENGKEQFKNRVEEYAVIENYLKETKKICKSISKSSKEYRPELTVQLIEDNWTKDESMKKHRISYSEIDNYLFSLQEEEQGEFETNMQNLFRYCLDDNKAVSTDCIRIVHKIYDHFALLFCQNSKTSRMISTELEMAREEIEEVMKKSLEDTSKEMIEEMKSMQKEYITILGIFASIMLAFVGGITFSTSVLENMHQSSGYKVVIIALTVGIVFINMIWILLNFIKRINGKLDKKDWSIVLIDVFLVILIVITVFMWKIS